MIVELSTCSAPGVVYKAECQLCHEDQQDTKAKNIGTTSHSILNRSGKHKDDAEANTQPWSWQLQRQVQEGLKT